MNGENASNNFQQDGEQRRFIFSRKFTNVLLGMAALLALGVYTGPIGRGTTTSCSRTGCFYTAGGMYSGHYYSCTMIRALNSGGGCDDASSLRGYFTTTTADCSGWVVNCTASWCNVYLGGCGSSGDPACSCSTTTIPNATVSGTPNCSSGYVNSWCPVQATLSLLGTDTAYSVTGIESNAYGILCGGASCVWNFPEGTSSFSFWALSSHLDTSYASSTSMKMDTVPPTANIRCNGGGCAATWYAIPVTVSLTATDATSGVASTGVSIDGGSTWAASAALPDGTTAVQGISTDLAGHSATDSATVLVDTIAPTASITCNGAACASVWYTVPVTVAVTGSDATSGIAASSALVSLDGGGSWVASASLPDGTNTVQGTIGDNAGHSTAASATIQVDTVSPVSSYTSSGGWARGDIVLTGTSVDSGSGIAHVYLTLPTGVIDLGPVASWSYTFNTTAVADGAYTIPSSAQDVAGNLEHTANLVINVDNTPPNVSLASPSIPLGGNNLVISSDAGSGLDHARVTISGNGITPRVYVLTSPLSGNDAISWDGLDGASVQVPPGSYDVLIEVWDAVGNLATTAGTWVRSNPVAPSPTRIAWTYTPTATATPEVKRAGEAVLATAAPTATPSPTPKPLAPILQLPSIPPPTVEAISRIILWPGLGMLTLFLGVGFARLLDRRPQELNRLEETLRRVRSQSRRQ